MKKFFFSLLSLCLLSNVVAMPQTTAATLNPPGYVELKWVGEPGITSFMRAPQYSGYIDYLTVISLSQNQIKLLSTTTPRIYEGPGIEPFADETTKNWLFPRDVAESIKTANPEAKFVWNAPFFNITMTSTVLSLGLKSSDQEGPYITSGGRPTPDMEENRRMLIIDNKLGTAKILDFDETIFVKEGDQAVEGFDPQGKPSNRDVQAARLYVGIRNNGTELVIYCSKSASSDEAITALKNAGVPVEEQIQLDGGLSATCGYNLPGQYFVEPGRALPHLMAAIPVKPKGTVTIEGLNVRTGPGYNNAAVRKLALGTNVTIFEEKSGWMRISETEWVSAQYVKKIKILPYTAKVNIDQLNVRNGAGTTFSVARKLAIGTEVRVLEEKNGWMRISETEWVMGRYIQ